MPDEKEVKCIPHSEAYKHCYEPDPETKGFYINQTSYRVKDPRKTLEFYTKVLGMRLIKKFDFPPKKFSLYLVGHEDAESIPKDEEEKATWVFTRRSLVEFTHNWGTENDPNFSYHNSNVEPRGYSHVCLVVPDVDEACDRFEKLGCKFIKKSNDGGMKKLGFIQDPDGYWIEILSPSLGITMNNVAKKYDNY